MKIHSFIRSNVYGWIQPDLQPDFTRQNELANRMFKKIHIMMTKRTSSVRRRPHCAPSPVSSPGTGFERVPSQAPCHTL
jgi:hypothetical protein